MSQRGCFFNIPLFRRRGSASGPPVATAFRFLDGTPAFASLGITAGSRARVFDQYGSPMASQAPYSETYTSSNTSVATVDVNGIVSAVANGTTTLTATATGYPNLTRTITVAQQPASITGVASTLSTNDTSSGTFTPTAKDANGNTIAGATFAYSSAIPSIISVNATTGAWAGQSAGSTTITITATANGASTTFTVNVTVTHVTYTLTAVPSPISGTTGQTYQLTVTENGVDVTADAGTVYSTANKAVATIDAPTLTSISPTTITQNTSGSYTFTGTNIKGTETIGGLPSGVTASAYSYTTTTVVCTLTATAGATTGAASVNLVSARGDSGTQTLTVNAASTLPTTGLLRRYVGSSGTNTAVDGGAITSWTDTIAGKVLTAMKQAGGSATTFFYTANGLNGKPGVRCAGGVAGEAMQEAAYDAAINTANTTVVAVLKLSSITALKFCIAELYTSGNGWGIETAATSGNPDTYFGSSGVAYTLSSGTSLGTTAGHTVMFTATTTGPANTFYVDNASAASDVTHSYTAQTSRALSLFNYIGYGAELTGTICEFLIYDHALSSTERTNLASYINATYAI